MKEPYPRQGLEVLCRLVLDPLVAFVFCSSGPLSPDYSHSWRLAVPQPCLVDSPLSPVLWFCLLSMQGSPLLHSQTHPPFTSLLDCVLCRGCPWILPRNRPPRSVFPLTPRPLFSEHSSVSDIFHTICLFSAECPELQSSQDP